MMNIMIRLGVTLGCVAALSAQIPECENVQTTASGLQYCVLKKGSTDQPSPRATDMVEVHYTGWLTDGKKFDSSRDRGEPTRFALNGVIKGWTEGVQLMTPGAVFKFVIPPALGYGSVDQGVIPPNSTLVFEVELLRVIAMPKLPAANAEAQQALPSGFRYEICRPGTGVKAEANDGVGFRYAIFQTDGTLIDCSERRNDTLLSGTKATLPFVFLQELVDRVAQGDVIRIEIPKGKVPSLQNDTIWLLELVGVHKLPKFRALDAQKTVTTQSGLKYEVVEPGKGRSPKATDSVLAHYTGWLADGSLFDSSHARGMPSEFPLSGVIPGWTEGLQLMKEGGTFWFEIPGELAYGAAGRPPKIPANATLLFLVELVEVR